MENRDLMSIALKFYSLWELCTVTIILTYTTLVIRMEYSGELTKRVTNDFHQG